jgi:hypothetical protein
MEACTKAMHRSKIEWQEIEEQGTLCFGRNREHLTTSIGMDVLKHILEIRRFTTIPNTIIDDLTVDLMRSDIN